jgi:Protein of unknown function (DUF1566)
MKLISKIVFAIALAIGLHGCGGGGTTSAAQTATAKYQKIDSSGASVPAATNFWLCTQDTTSGLTWEIKTTDGGLRDLNWVYTAYETTGANGNGVCDQTKTCNQNYFRDAVNTVGLCGHSDWRLPTLTELEGLQDKSQTQSPYINITFFPNTKPGIYWTGSGIFGLNSSQWWVDFSTIRSASTPFRDIQNYVRLVRP